MLHGKLCNQAPPKMVNVSFLFQLKRSAITLREIVLRKICDVSSMLLTPTHASWSLLFFFILCVFFFHSFFFPSMMLKYSFLFYFKFCSYQSTLKQLFKEFDNGDPDAQLASVTTRIMQALQTNLEGKSKQYRDAALTQLFLMNNIHYIVRSVRRYVTFSAADLATKISTQYQYRFWAIRTDSLFKRSKKI